MPRKWIAFCVVALVVAVATLADAAVATHLKLTRSVPAADAELADSPADIRLWFSQSPELAVSRITLHGPDGAVELGKVERVPDEDVLFAVVPGVLVAGKYEVSWRTSSGDGHPIRGEFGFSVAATR